MAGAGNDGNVSNAISAGKADRAVDCLRYFRLAHHRICDSIGAG